RAPPKQRETSARLSLPSCRAATTLSGEIRGTGKCAHQPGKYVAASPPFPGDFSPSLTLLECLPRRIDAAGIYSAVLRSVNRRGRPYPSSGTVVALPPACPCLFAAMAKSADSAMPDDWLSRLVGVKEGKAMSETNTATMA